MITRNTWILLGILVVLVGVVFFIPWYQGKHPAATPTVAATQPVQVFSTGTLTQFTVQSKDGKKVVVKSDANNNWKVTEPTDLTYDSSTVATAAGFFTTAVVQDVLPTQPPADVMGISAPQDTITVQMKDGSQKVLKVGNATPTGDGYYVQVDNQPAYTVSKTGLGNVLALLTAGQPPATPSVAAPGAGTPAVNPLAPTQASPAASPTGP